MANAEIEVAGYIRSLIDIGASATNETGVARRLYAPAVYIVGASGGAPAVTGTLTNNAAAPAATNNLGVLPAIANAAVPTWTEGRQVLLSVDLSGRQRSAGTLTNNAAAPPFDNIGTLGALANAAAPSWTEGRQVALSTDLTGRLRTAGTLTNNTAAPVIGHIGTLSAVANAAIQTWTEGNEVLLSTDLSGRLRVAGSLTNNNAAPAQHLAVLPAMANAAAPTWTEGFEVVQSVDLSGNQRSTLGTLLSGEDQANNILRVGGKGGGWQITHNPAVDVKATISQAAGGGTVRNVVTSLSFGFANDATGPTPTILTVNLRDGATGAGTVLRAWTLFAPATVGYNFNITLTGLWIEGSQNTACTVEYAAGLVHCLQYVNMGGCTIAA